MAKHNTTNPAPQPETDAATGTPGNAAPGTAAKAEKPETVVHLKPSKPVTNMLLELAMAENAEIREKSELLTETRELLGLAHSKFEQGGDSEAAGRELASEAAYKLAQARISGTISADEVSSILGDEFGYKVKGKPQAGATPTTVGVPATYQENGQTASKTPFGIGEHLRKRIVRIEQGWQYVNGMDTPKFYQDMDETDVSEVLNRLDNGEITIWSAYDTLAEIKREGGSSRVDMVLDAKRIAAFTAKLAGENIPAAALDTPGLRAAYSGLLKMLLHVGEAMTALENERAEAA